MVVEGGGGGQAGRGEGHNDEHAIMLTPLFEWTVVWEMERGGRPKER